MKTIMFMLCLMLNISTTQAVEVQHVSNDQSEEAIRICKTKIHELNERLADNKKNVSISNHHNIYETLIQLDLWFTEQKIKLRAKLKMEDYLTLGNGCNNLTTAISTQIDGAIRAKQNRWKPWRR